MKKLFLLITAAIGLLAVACEYDDTGLRNSITQLEQRLDAVEAVQRAYENNLFITNISEINNGYIITFSDGSHATIVNGENGKDGVDGKDGADGQDGADGKDGEDGQDGKNGKDGKDGDTLIKSITIGEDSVTIVLTDGRSFTIPLYSSLSVSFSVDEHTCISPNTTFKINYEVKSNISDIMIDVVSSHDLYAFVSDAHAKKGQIEVAVGNAIDLHSRIVVFVSNGEKTIMRRLTFEEAALQIADNSIKSLPIEGGTVNLEYLSNVECEVVIPSDAKSWLSVVPATRALEQKSVTLKAEANSEKPRSTTVSIKYAIGGLELKYTINQDGLITSLEYTTNDGKPLDPYTTEGFGTTLIENNYDASTGRGALVFNGRPTKIPANAFLACTNLTWIDIPISIASIGNSAFKSCSSMEQITIPSSVKSIGALAFEGCGGKATINCNIATGSWKAEEGLFYKARFTEVVIGNGITSSIGGSAFSDCTSLTSVTIGNGVTSIGRSAFDGCNELTSVTIPDSVTEIGQSAFNRCTSLTSITIPNSVTSIRSKAFQDCTSLTRVDITDLSAWCKIRFEDYSANPLCHRAKLYLNGSELTDITIPSDITEIKAYAFCGYSLTSVTIPDSVTSIGNYAFENCTSLTSVTIGNSVTSIGSNAFENCTSLTSVTIPDSVTKIGGVAFAGCTSLTSVTIPDSVTSIGNYAFHGCTSLTSVTIPDSVTSIGSNAFENCTSLTSVTIGNRVTSIGNYAFHGCTSLTSITIPNSVTAIGANAFAGCSSLTSINIPDSVTLIGWSAFENCSSLESVTIPDSVTLIGWYAFENCSSLESVTIPDSVTEIGNSAFSGCTSLTSVTIPDSVTKIGGVAFAGCTSLTSVTIPDSVTSIGNYAFHGCTSLTSVTIPDSVTSIGDSAFSGCTSLKEVYCKPTTPPTGNSSMFHENATGRKIYVPLNSVDAYKSASYWSSYASYIVEYDF